MNGHLAQSYSKTGALTTRPTLPLPQRPSSAIGFILSLANAQPFASPADGEACCMFMAVRRTASTARRHDCEVCRDATAPARRVEDGRAVLSGKRKPLPRPPSLGKGDGPQALLTPSLPTPSLPTPSRTDDAGHAPRRTATLRECERDQARTQQRETCRSQDEESARDDILMTHRHLPRSMLIRMT